MLVSRIKIILEILGNFFTRYNHITKSEKFKKIYKFNLIYFFNDKVSREISIRGIFDYDQLFTTIKFFKKKRIFIDVGANIGNHSIFYSKYFKKILSFEPSKISFKVLSLNVENLKNIKIFNFGLSNISKEFYFDDKATKNVAGLKFKKKGKIPVKAEVFDEKFKKLKNIDLVKIDVEGHELNVIEGMKKTLKNNSPLLIIEFDPFKYRNSKLIRKIKKFGYQHIYYFVNTNNEDKIRLRQLPWTILRTLLFGRKKSKVYISSFENLNFSNTIMRDNILCSKKKLV